MSDSNFRAGIKNLKNDRKSRFMLVGAAAIIIVGMVFAFSPRTNVQQTSSLPTAPNTPNPQGGNQLNPRYAEALRTADKQRAEEAEEEAKKGRAAASLPTPQFMGISEKIPSIFGDRQETGKEPPIPEPVKPIVVPPVVLLQPEPPKPIPQQTVAQQQTNNPQVPPPMDMELVRAMQNQMGKFLNRPLHAAETLYFYNPTATNGNGQPKIAAINPLPGIQASGNGLSNTNSNIAQVANSMNNPTRNGRFSPPAPGTILYSRLIGRVNSDVPGPVIAEIEQGPLRGARLLGSFQFTEQGVIIQYSTMTVPFTEDGLERTEVVPIRAVAVDQENLGTAMATSIDRRILERIAFGFATSFIQGLGQAITQSGSSTTLSNAGVTYGLKNLNTGQQLLAAGGNAAGTAGRILDQAYGNKRTTIIVESDTPFGLLFLGNSNSTTQ